MHADAAARARECVFVSSSWPAVCVDLHGRDEARPQLARPRVAPSARSTYYIVAAQEANSHCCA